MLLNMQPAPPMFVRGFDFEFVGPVRGYACGKVEPSFALSGSAIWLMAAGLENIPVNATTRRVIGEAALAAVEQLAKADTIVVTRVVTTTPSKSEVCATVVGRAVRVTMGPLTNLGAPDRPGPSDADSDDSSDDED